jgi:hypothetical protein
MTALDRLLRLLVAAGAAASAACAREPAPRMELVADPPEVPLVAVSPPAPPAPPPSVSTSATTAPADGPLQDELALLDRAYNAVRAAGRVAPKQAPELDEAAKSLDHLEREFPRGLLRQEAQMLRVEVSCLRGDVARVRALATRFVAEYPRSPGVARMQRFLEYPLPCTGNSHPDPKAPYCCIWPYGMTCDYP